MTDKQHSRIKQFVASLDRIEIFLLGMMAGILLALFLFTPEVATTPGPEVMG